MHTNQISLPAFWSEYLRARSKPPFVHPEDQEYFDSINYWSKHPDSQKELTFQQYIRSHRFGDFKTGDFHLSLQPVPYAGNLRTAVAFILLLNPGFAHGDYYTEYCNSDFIERLDQNMRQDFRGVEFPFLYLDPSFCWTSGFQWWESKLRKVIEELARRCFRSCYRLALRFAACRLASIELIPYHSNNFKNAVLINRLPSALMARSAAEGFARTVGDREICIVVTRQIAAWNLTNVPDRIVCYTPAEARGAHLTPQSKGGKIILERLEAAYREATREDNC